MAINKVVYGNRTLVDMTNATAGADDIVSGKTAYGRSGALLTGTRSVGGLIRAVYTENVTSGSQYTLRINGYTEGKSLIDAFLNGLRLTESEFTITTAGLFRLTNTITGSGNIIQVVHWEQVNGEYVAPDVGSASITFAEAASRNNINSRETVSTIFGKIRKWFSDLKAVAFSGSYNDLTNKPTIPAAVSVKGNAESSYRTGQVNLTPANIGAPARSELKQVAFSGSYNDLTSKPTIPAAVSVKGNAESSYRTGQVNLTPANIGAVNKSGDEITGMLGINVPSQSTAAQASYISLGNATPSGQVGNSRGRIRIYGTNNKYCDIGLENPSSDVNIWMPLKSGKLETQWEYANSFSNTGTYTIPTDVKDLTVVVYVGGSQNTAHIINIPMPRDSRNLGKIFLTGFYYSDKYYGTIAVQISASGVLSLYNGWCRVNYNGTTITRADMTAYIYTR